MAATISYIPEPHERAYYEGLFQAADVQRSNNIGGQQAVQFFSRSKLPVDVLKNIWTVADQPSTSSLSRQKFAVAIRLIQLTQNGIKGQGANLAVPPGVTLRPAFLEGVSGVSVPLPPAGPGASVGAPPSHPGSPVSMRSAMTGPPPSQATQMPQMMPTPGSQRTSFSAPPPGAVGNNALVPQDPYSMTPEERGRYEALFPQYAKPDGFCYGGEAVALFMKSGVDQQVLRELWNIVDRPVDNRLDKLEFVIAMHLIVCISKKNLPPPQGQLPPSLQVLKVPPTPSMPPRPDMMQQQQQQQPAAGAMPPQLGGAPQLAQPGGMSISDAFEGLSTDDGLAPADPSATAALAPQEQPVTAALEPPSLPSYVPAEQQQPQQTPAPVPAPAPQEQPTMAAPQIVEPKAAAAPTPPPSSTKELASSYQMGEASEELTKLQGVLQKLQAENISLKAQLGSMTEEEKNVQKELSATVSEIGTLSNTLQTRRQEVLEAKTKLLETSSKIKAAREQKGVLNGLIGEATETKAAINEATDSMQNIVSATEAQQQHDAALQKQASFEENLFGYNAGIPEPSGGAAPMSMPAPQQLGLDPSWGATPMPMPAPEQLEQQPNRGPTMSFDSSTAPPGVAGSTSVDVSLLNQPPSSPQQQVFPDIPLVTTVSSEDELHQPQHQAPLDDAPEMFENDPVPPPAAQPDFTMDPRGPSPVPPPQQNQQQPQSAFDIPTPQPAQQYQQYAAPPPQQQQYPPQQYTPAAISPVPPQQYQQPVAAQSPMPTPQFGLARPQVVANHSRKESVGGFGSDFVMGGSAQIPQLPPDNVHAAAAAATAAAFSTEEDMKEVEELKRKARMARETANDAEAAHRNLASQANELREDADKAEANARSLRAAAEEKKKGRFGSGGKKKQMNRDAEKAAGDAQEIRKRFMAVQAQAHDAQAVAMETKREAERLNEEIEKAELDVAAKASMQEQQRMEQVNLQKAQQASAAEAAAVPNGYPPQQQAYAGYGQPQQQQVYAPYGQPPQQQPYGYGAPAAPPAQQYGMPPPAVGGYPAGAGGGFEGIPAPPAGGDPYANPF